MNDRLKYRVFDKVASKYIDLKDFRKGEIEFNFDPDTQTIWIEYDKSRYVVEQCTGLKDKNGKLIFEGDIVMLPDEDSPFLINYEIDMARFIIESQTERLCCDFDNYYGRELEVIGNIFENPELLGGEQC